MTDKLIRDGKVAVIYSPGFGAGWSTWCNDGRIDRNDLIFWPQLALALLGEIDRSPDDVVGEIYPEDQDDDEPYFYLGGLENCVVKWLPIGTRFEITEYDGRESIRFLTPDMGYVA